MSADRTRAEPPPASQGGACMKTIPITVMLLLLTACAAGPAREGPGADSRTMIGEVGEPRNRARIHTDLAAAYFERGNMAVALEELRLATGADPGYAPAYSLLGLVYMELRERELAGQELRARAGPCAQRRRDQPQLRPVPVPDRARAGLDQVLHAGGKEPALRHAVALVQRGGAVHATREAMPRRPSSSSSERCAWSPTSRRR